MSASKHTIHDPRSKAPFTRLKLILQDQSTPERREMWLEEAGVNIPIWPGVFPSDKGEGSSQLRTVLMSKGDEIAGKTVLELGTGNGTVAICAAAQNAAKVVATDLNSTARSNARESFDSCIDELRGRLTLIDADVDVFDGLAEKLPVNVERFDWIIFNPPFLGADWRTEAVLDIAGIGNLASVFDVGQLTLCKFLVGARKHLSAKGSLLLAYSDDMPLEQFRWLTDRLGYERKYCTSGLRSFGEGAERDLLLFFVVQLSPKDSTAAEDVDLTPEALASELDHIWGAGPGPQGRTAGSRVRSLPEDLKEELKRAGCKYSRAKSIARLWRKYGFGQIARDPKLLAGLVMAGLLLLTFALSVAWMVTSGDDAAWGVGTTIALSLLCTGITVFATVQPYLGPSRLTYTSLASLLDALEKRIARCDTSVKLCALLPLPGILLNRNIGTALLDRMRRCERLKCVAAFAWDEQLMLAYHRLGKKPPAPGRSAEQALTDTLSFRADLSELGRNRKVSFYPMRIAGPPCILAIFDGELAFAGYFVDLKPDMKPEEWFKGGFETSHPDQVKALEGLFNYVASNGEYDPGFVSDAADAYYPELERDMLRKVSGAPRGQDL